MNTEHLITMANQIGGFFESYPDAEEARAEIVSHIKRFWAPRMRLILLEHVARHDGAGLQPLVLAAIRAQVAELTPRQPAALDQAA